MLMKMHMHTTKEHILAWQEDEDSEVMLLLLLSGVPLGYNVRILDISGNFRADVFCSCVMFAESFLKEYK